MGSRILGMRIIGDYSHHLVVFVYTDATHTRSAASEGTEGILFETDAPAVLCRNHNLLAAIGKHCIQQGIPFADSQSDDTLVAAALVGIVLKRGLFDDSLLGYESNEVVLHVFRILDAGSVKIGSDAVVGID